MGKYRLELAFSALDDYETGSTEQFGGFTEVRTFEVPGGSRRSFWSDQELKLGVADRMAEFYQAKQFERLQIQKLRNRASLSISLIRLPSTQSFRARYCWSARERA